ncbi:hypothetical protein F4778DRAFT_745366 [Xylariomycetidae sp. FL2044]|nr:hypothetical protein F4778DRAFT_745366 [Xylariomycetidae sp. FL2044]
MPSTTRKLAVLAAAVGRALGHAVMQDPAPRVAGDSSLALCGAAVSKILDRDLAGPIENAVAVVDADYNCNLYLCRGYQYEDNIDNVQVVHAGDVMYFHIDLVAGHKPGYANVSVIDLAANTAIGEPLRSWDNWPDSASGPPRDDIDFNVTIPDSLTSSCSEGGQCAIQWYWYSQSNSQTYESCLDFYIED